MGNGNNMSEDQMQRLLTVIEHLEKRLDSRLDEMRAAVVRLETANDEMWAAVVRLEASNAKHEATHEKHEKDLDSGRYEVEAVRARVDLHEAALLRAEKKGRNRTLAVTGAPAIAGVVQIIWWLVENLPLMLP